MIWRAIFAMAAAAALFTVYLWDVERTERRILTEIQEQQALFLTPETTTAVRFVNQNGEFLAVRDRSGEWRLEEPRDLPADGEAIENFLENLRGAKRHSVFLSNDLTAYGLDKPSRSVTVSFEQEGELVTRTLELGNQPSALGKVYARVVGGDELFTVSDWLYRRLDVTLGDLREKNIAPASLASAERITIAKRGDVFSVNRTDAGGWQLSGAGEKPLPADRVLMDRFLQSMADGRFLTVIDDPTSTTAQLGLDDPLARVTADGEPVIEIGNRIPKKEQLIVRREGETIGVVPASMVADVFRPATEWGTKRFIWIDQENIQQIETSTGNTRMMLMRSEEDGWIFPAMPDAPVREDRMTEFLDNLVSLRSIKLQRQTVPVGEETNYGIVPETYRVLVQSKDGVDQGFQFGRTEPSEGYSYVLRLQDRSLWRVDFRQQHMVYRLTRDMEERRILPGLIAKTDRFEAEVKGRTMTFEKTPAAWRVIIPERNPAVVPPSLVRPFLEAFQAMESESEMITGARYPAEMTFRFYRELETKPWAVIDLLSRDPNSKRAFFRKDGRHIEISKEQFDALDQAMVDLFTGSAIQSEQDSDGG